MLNRAADKQANVQCKARYAEQVVERGAKTAANRWSRKRLDTLTSSSDRWNESVVEAIIAAGGTVKQYNVYGLDSYHGPG